MGHVYKRSEKNWYYCLDVGTIDGKRKRIKKKVAQQKRGRESPKVG